VLGSRLGYRITARFVEHFLGRMFQTPNAVFSDDMLRPELQGLAPYAAGIDAIVDTQTRVALSYFADGSVDAACPPLKALLHIMAHGQYEGMTAADPKFRAMFTREAMLHSDWYHERLRTKQRRDVDLLRRHAATLDAKLQRATPAAGELLERRRFVARELERVSAQSYLDELLGTLGADPFHFQTDSLSTLGQG